MKVRHFLFLILVLVPALATAQMIWTEHVISTEVSGPKGVNLVDLDGDGDLDVLGATYVNASVYCYFNDGGLFTEASFTSPFDESNAFGLGDFDLDGDPDIVLSDGELLAIGDNNGSGQFTFTTLDGFTAEYLTNADIVDLDGDGDSDLLLSDFSGDVVTWLEFEGETWTQHTIGTGYYPQDADVADVDGDGDLDVVYTSLLGHPCYIALQTATGWDVSEPDIRPNQASQVELADYDGDGDIDIVCGASTGYLTMYTNDGQVPPNWEYTDLGDIEASSLKAANFGQNDYVEFVAASYDQQPRNVLGYRYVYGEWHSSVITTNDHFDCGIDIGDVDGDGRLDVLSADYNQISWLQYNVPTPGELTLTPDEPSPTVPPGGSFGYAFHLELSLDEPMPGRIWTDVVLPNGTVYGPMHNWSRTFTGDDVFDMPNRVQNVPLGIAPGTYTFRAFVGDEDFAVGAWDSFDFEVTAAGAVLVTDATVDEWAAGSVPFPGVSGLQGQAGLVQDGCGHRLKLEGVSPNPFNPETSVRISLAESSTLRVRVFNALGQRVALLADGPYSAGEHRFVVDGSTWASGIYLIQAKAGGETVQQKIILMK